VVLDGGNTFDDVYFYVDGNPEPHGGGTETIDTTAGDDVMIGKDRAPSFFGGAIDDLRIYSRALSATEVEEIYLLGAGTKVFINELHYDNDNPSADEYEGVEIAGPAGTSLDGWEVYVYNGADGTVDGAALDLSGYTIPNQQNGFGTVWFDRAGIQNGAPDGLALVNGGTVVQFLSYEGTFAATAGPANGMTSVDMGVMEDSPVPDTGNTLQLIGTGKYYEDFMWQDPAAHTRGAVNTGQTFQP
jgi:hypothetical protein